MGAANGSVNQTGDPDGLQNLAVSSLDARHFWRLIFTTGTGRPTSALL